jgi:D-aspartate ligase
MAPAARWQTPRPPWFDRSQLGEMLSRGAAAANPCAVVIGLDTLAGLQTCRILARRGVRVIGIASDSRHPACSTNTCSRLLIAPAESEPLLTALERLAEQEAGAVLFPCTDASVRAVAHASERLHAFRSVLPAAEVVEILSDGRRFAELADTHGLPVPPTRIVTDLDSAHRAAYDLRFPCGVKPSVSTPPWESSGAAVRCFEDATAWLAAAGTLLKQYPELVVQERMADTASAHRYACSCYVSPHGLPILTFITRSLRQWPPRLGDSCAEEPVDDHDIRHLALDVFSCVAFVGFGTVEIERDARTGVDRIVGVTVGRPTDQTGLAEAGGVELLHTAYRDAVDAPLPAGRRQRDRPVTWVHVVDDLRSTLHTFRRRQLTATGRLLRLLRRQRVYAMLDASDPAPFVADLNQRFRALLRRRWWPSSPPPTPPRGWLRQLILLGRRHRAIQWAVALLPSSTRAR